VLALLVLDATMCALTGVSWLIQKLVFLGYLDWDREGWIVQHVWQTLFVWVFVGLPQARDWPWSHTVFFVLHGLVLLMKQHSYASYNGHLSSASGQRSRLLAYLRRLEETTMACEPDSPRFAQTLSLDQVLPVIDSGTPLDAHIAGVFWDFLEQEIAALTDELVRNTTKREMAYPNNLTIRNFAEYLALPTVVYELEYPRSDSINWAYVGEKVAAIVGILFVMNMLSQTFICTMPRPCP
jgi:sterol O-acyltransferase